MQVCTLLDELYFPYNAEIFLHKLWRPNGFFQFKVVNNVLVSSFTFEYLWIYAHCQIFLIFRCGDRL